ncbi:MAG: adenylate/guanylate cyclase domain-containing protein [Actinomycetota bacterium]
MHADLPTGTVTFLFTDVEGSTKLLHELGAEAYAEALAEHRQVIREACASHGGIEVDTQGDAFFVAFPTAPGALEAAAAMTEALVSSHVQVRVGLHTGTPLPTEEGYVGGDVHRAARIAAAGYGGQVLVSSSTAQLVGRELRDLGEHRFKDLSAPERVFQLGDRRFPPLTSLYRTNLPIPATPFLGRERELAEVVQLFGGEDVRLLTLTGPGGTGKTRLALQVAAEMSDRFPDGVWWVPLAPLRDPKLVLGQAAQVVGSKTGITEHIADRRMLCLFDNFEQVVEAGAGLADLLAACPNLHILVTSRERLRVRGEHTYPVSPLAERDGEALFTARARAVVPSFTGGDAVRELCLRLDELPLALELAAARIALFSPEQLLERLSQRLDLLKGDRDADPRQQTLRATIEWSFDLLNEEEQELFCRLSVFAGGCTYEAAEEVAGADPDTLQTLLDKSLLGRRESALGSRYWMLGTIREFAAQRLTETNEGELLRDRHLAFYLELVEEAEPRLTGADQHVWYERLASEQENVREALTFSCDRGDRERALMLAGTIWRFWWSRGQVDEASRWYERAFSVGQGASESARARGLFGAAHMAEARGDVVQAREQFEEAANLLRRIGETRWLILALSHLSGTYEETDRRLAERIGMEALALAEASGDIRGAAIVKGNLAGGLLAHGEDLRAAELLEEALEGHRALGDVYGIATCLASLSTLALRRGDLDGAAATLRESLQLSHSIGDALTISSTLSTAAAVMLARGDTDTAARLASADEVLVRAHGFEPDPQLSEIEQRVRDLLGERSDDAWAAGGNLDLAAAVEFAIGSLSEPGTRERS